MKAMRWRCVAALLTVSVSIACAVEADAPHRAGPTIFVAGDSTAARTPGDAQQGWGEPFAQYFDASKVRVLNRARGGRSSRTFITGGEWDALLAELTAGDIVLIQFGHNDAGALNQEPPGSTRPLRARGTIAGVGEETEAIDNVVTGKHEIVHTYGWYLRRMIADVRARSATPVLLTLTLRNAWVDGKIECGTGSYRDWAHAIAREQDVAIVDARRIIADRYRTLGPSAVAKLFGSDDIHTNEAGADLNAQAIVAGLRSLQEPSFDEFLSSRGAAIESDGGQSSASVCPAIRSL